VPTYTPSGLIAYEAYNSEELKENLVEYTGDNLPLLYYDWLADSMMISHICNQCNAFAEYIPIIEHHTVIDIRGSIHPQGQGSTKLKTNYVKSTYTFTL
jgi:hypothetical protein